MARLIHIRKANGQTPVNGVELVDSDAPGATRMDATLVFDVSDLGKGECAQTQAGDAPSLDLVKYAACMTGGGGMISPSVDAFLEFARQSGPLFGLTTEEPLRGWGCAALSALLAVRILECTTGQKPYGALAALQLVQRQGLVIGDDPHEVTLLHTNLPVFGPYKLCLEGLPLVRREIIDGVFCHMFAQLSCDPDGSEYLDIWVFALARPLRAQELDALTSAMGIDAELSQRMQDAYGFGAAAKTPSESLEVAGGDVAAPGEDDVPAMTALLQLLSIVHLGGAHLDPFQGDELTGYLSFGSFLSWLWYDFVRRLHTPKIGYCEQCGRAFSLVGHRGRVKRYCSGKCKTDAKNARVRRCKTKVRTSFLEGKDVASIARSVYGGSADDAARVRSDLSSWVDLKHLLDESIEDEGWTKSSLLKRCRDEGLDLGKLLSQKRLQELKALRKTRSS